jgi:hypothetical protein
MFTYAPLQVPPSPESYLSSCAALLTRPPAYTRLPTEWALPVAAFSTLSLGVLIPLILKPGVDSFNAGASVRV